MEGAGTDPAAAATLLPLEDLDRTEAIELLSEVFGATLEQPAELISTSDIRAYRSDFVAVTEPDPFGAGSAPSPGLLTSSIPLRVENDAGVKAPVNLELEQTEGELQPQNPIVDVGIPAQVGEGISLPDADVTIKMDGAPADRAASALDGSSAFYPNVAADSDLAVVPTPTGVETFMQLRSADAPDSHTFHIDIPAGSELESTPDGGARVREEDSNLVTIPPPTAMDAAGRSVPASLTVSRHSLEVRAAVGEDTTYPVLVDPIFESYYWDFYPEGESPEWRSYEGTSFRASWAAWMLKG